MTEMPTFETTRLIIRPLVLDDLPAIHRILDVDLRDVDFGNEGPQSLSEREAWLQWTVLSYQQLAQLNQPPYGERAVVLRHTGQLIGACGFVPCLAPFEQVPALSHAPSTASDQFMTTEFGLYYAIAPASHGHGYATEAAQAMVDYAFRHLRLKRVVATTPHANAASIAVMRKLGMQIERNPHPEPPWLQVVGILAAPKTRRALYPLTAV